MIANAGQETIDEKWLYIFDVAPTFTAIMALAIIHPYELPYAAMFEKTGGRCRTTNTTPQSEIPPPEDQAVPPPYVQPPAYHSGSATTLDDPNAATKVYDPLHDKIKLKYYERE